MLDQEAKQNAEKVISLLERGIVALERIADHLAPQEEHRKRKPATLGTATYTREEQNRKELRKTFGGKDPQPKG